jgi:hypothetical protein
MPPRVFERVGACCEGPPGSEGYLHPTTPAPARAPLDELRALLKPHRANSTVAEFLPCLEHALRGRRDLYRWLSSDATGAG